MKYKNVIGYMKTW